MASKIVKKSTKSDPPVPEAKGVFRVLDFFDRMILKMWRVFISLKFGISLLIIIGIASVYGTMRYASNAAYGDNAIPMARALYFESYWFVALLLLFACNLIISTWHVTKMSFGIWGKKDFRKGKTFFTYGKSPRAEVALDGGIEEAEGFLRKHFTRVHRDGDALFAHKGLISRWGPTIVHIGILMVIFSQVGKAILMWNGQIVTEGRFLASEGGPAINFINEPIAMEQLITDKNRREVTFGSWVRVMDFDEIKHPNSEMPAYFSSLLEVRDPVTQKVTVAQLDMNHSLKIGDLQFHQAGFTPADEIAGDRMNFDIRDTITGERIAVTDADPGNRVRVGETELFLEVDGIHAADRWRLYAMDAPTKVVAEGLLTGGKKLNYAFRTAEFFPDFRIDAEERVPTNVSNEPNNPALRVDLLLDGKKVGEQWLFMDPRLAEVVPETHPRFSLRLTDIRLKRGIDVANADWSNPDHAIFQVNVIDRKSGESTGNELLAIDETSRAYSYETSLAHDSSTLGSENNYEVRILGPTQRYTTILSVVREPTVFWTKVGVALMTLGAMITFLVRYTAFYAWRDPKSNTVRLAMVPRWGQAAENEEFDELVHSMTGGKGPIVRNSDGVGTNKDEVAPAHETVNPKLVNS